jgi:hypothetical protein
MRFPVAAKMTFEAPVQTAAALPWRLFPAMDYRSSASCLCRIRQPTNFRRRVYLPTFTGRVRPKQNHAQHNHNSAAASVGNPKREMLAIQNGICSIA